MSGYIPTTEERDRILNAWAAGTKGDDIAKDMNFRKSLVFRTVAESRKLGDPRAVSRADGNKGTTSVNSQDYYSKHDLCGFDFAFKTRMLAAIAEGHERAEIGVYKAAPKRARA